jgi:(heptosyl)LPS beta-1,4-glucosyltransferase
MAKLTVVINTLNEEKNLPRALASVEGLADEIIVVDQESEDATAKIAKEAGAKVYEHKKTGYVEPVRNFAIGKAGGDWILILDADEELGEELRDKIKEITNSQEKIDYYRIARKNIIFGKWMEHTGWWPDYNIRLFKKGKVVWNETIHSVPVATGVGNDLEQEEQLAIVHNNYANLDDYFGRMIRYTSIQAELLQKEGKYHFVWRDLILKPTGEFISRYFAGEGYKDGAHGLALSLLQAFSELILYLKVWQSEKFQPQAITIDESLPLFKKIAKEINWWVADINIKSKDFISTLSDRLERHFSK